MTTIKLSEKDRKELVALYENGRGFLLNVRKLAWMRRRALELRRKIDNGEATKQEKDEYVKIFYEAWL